MDGDTESKFNFIKKNLKQKKVSKINFIKSYILNPQFKNMIIRAVDAITFPAIIVVGLAMLMTCIHMLVNLSYHSDNTWKIRSEVIQATALPKNKIESALKEKFKDLKVVKTSEKTIYSFQHPNNEFIDYFEITVTDSEKVFKLIDSPIENLVKRGEKLKESMKNIKEVKYLYKEKNADIVIIEEL